MEITEEKIELKPCPFCGGEDIKLVEFSSSGKAFWGVECKGACNLDFGMEETKKGVADLWNRRLDEQKTADAERRLADLIKICTRILRRIKEREIHDEDSAQILKKAIERARKKGA
jgi:Lar family restriction alleviation protein